MKSGTRWWITTWIVALGLCGLILPVPAPAETGLVAWWPGNGTTQEVVGGHHGVLQSGAGFNSAVVAQGFRFDGLDDRVGVADSPDLALTGSLTISAWVYLDNAPVGVTERHILFRGDNRADLDPYHLGLDRNGQLVFHIESATSTAELAATVPTQRFIHVAGSLDDATGLMRLYVDGQVVAQQVTTVRPLGALNPAYNPAVGIGNHGGFPNTPYNLPFAGIIDEVKLHNRALTPVEIQGAYQENLAETLVVSGFYSGNVARFGALNGTLLGVIGVGQLNLPAGTAYGPDGRLYVAALGDDQILKFDATSGALLGTFVLPGSGGLDAPEGIAFGPDRNLYVASRLTDQVLRYHGTTGEFLGVFASGHGLDEPFDLLFGPDGNLYVSSRGSASVMRFNGRTGAFISHFVASGAGGLQLDEPRGIVFGPDRNLYVVAPRTDRVLAFNGNTGVFLGDFIVPGAGGLDEPAGIKFGPDGHVYVTSTVTDDVRRFTAAGQFIDIFATGGGLTHATYLTFSPAAVGNRAPVADAGPDRTLEWDGANLLVQLNASGSGDLDWDPLSYEWRRNGTVVATGPMPSVSLPLGMHTFTLTVRDPHGETDSDTVVVNIVDAEPNPPPAPERVSVAPLSTSQLKVTWMEQAPGANAAPQSLRVERKVNGSFAEVGQVAPGVLQFTESGLPANTMQTYRIRAYNQGRFSAPSPEVTAATLPLTPQSLTVSAAVPGRLDLAWTDPNPVKATTRIERSEDGGLSFTFVGNAPAGTSTFQNFGLQASKEYWYRLKAINSWGESGSTAAVSGTTLPPVPLAPGNPQITNRTQTTLRLAWSQPAGPVLGFKVQLKSGMDWIAAGTTGAAELSLDITGLQPASPYTLRVLAYNAAGDSPPSSEVTGETLPFPPNAPANFHAVAQSHSSVRLTWVDASGETSYRIERQLGAAGSFAELTTLGANSTEWTDSGLPELTRSAYRIVALNAGGASGAATASATTLPQAPTGLSATLLIRHLQLSWTDVSTAEGGYRVERKVGKQGWQLIANLPANSTAFRSDNLTAGSTYIHRVTAVGPGGEPSSLPAEAGPITVPLNVAGPRLIVSPRSLNFRQVKRGRAKGLNLVLKNTGTAPMSVLVETPAAPFRIVSGGGLFTLAPKGKRTVRVEFRPDKVGAWTGSVPIITNAAVTPSLSAPLRGSGK